MTLAIVPNINYSSSIFNVLRIGCEEANLSSGKLVSALVPFYGDPTDALKLVQQLKEQTLAADIEIIVSDDASATPFPNLEGIKLIRRKTNGGFAANVNTAASQAGGRWLFILNSDLSLESDFVEKALRKAESLGPALISPQILDQQGKGQYVGRKFPTTFQITWEWLTPLARIRHTDLWHKLVGHDLACRSGKTLATDWLMGACMILPAQLYRDLGGMDERFFMNSEEVDLQRRLKERGIARIFAGDLTVHHLGGASSGSSQTRRQWVLNSRFIYAKKWQEGKHLAGCLKAATYFNYAVNLVRQLQNKNLDARAIKEEELELIRTAQQKG